MAKYVLETTDDQEAALTAIVAKSNASEPKAKRSNEEYLQFVFESILASYVEDAKREEMAKVCKCWDSAPQDLKDKLLQSINDQAATK